MDLVLILPAFLFTIGVLVTVHEFGHFWVARKMGVKVLRFSIGFGKPLYTWYGKHPDNTEYVLAMLPLGGYVKMLDEREGDVQPNELSQAFTQKNVWARFAIVAAGPLANFILAIFLYALLFMTGNPATLPQVSALNETPASAAGFMPGDRITAINGKSVTSWESARMALLEEYLDDPVLSVSVQALNGGSEQRRLDLSGAPLLKHEGDFLRHAGLVYWVPETIITLPKILPDSAAAEAGLKDGDKVLAYASEEHGDVEAFVSLINASANQPLDLRIEREGSAFDLTVTPRPVEVDGETIGRIGAHISQAVPPDVLESIQFTERHGLFSAFALGLAKTWQSTELTFRMIGRMLKGEVSLKNISGPVTIAKYSGETAAAGLPYFLGFLSIVSISLGVLNLLPIPMLDGGHLLYYLIEIVKGSPVSAEFEDMGLRVGMMMVGGIMVLALYNDIIRLFN